MKFVAAVLLYLSIFETVFGMILRSFAMTIINAANQLSAV